MGGKDAGGTVQFDGPVDFHSYIYDRCVEPGMSGDERLFLSVAIAHRTVEIWPDIEDKYRVDAETEQ